MVSDIRNIEIGLLHRRLITMVEGMPPFPESVHQVMVMSSDINCSPKDMVKVIEHDPVLTVKILKIVNSAFFALSRQVASVQHALVYLGMNTIKNLAVAIATVNVLPRKSIPELPIASFLTHSLATAVVAQHLAKDNLQVRDTSNYFVAGLLHDFGKVVLIQFEPSVYAKVLNEAHRTGCPLPQVEQDIMGLSCAEVGALLTENWQLPEELVDCIRMHVNCSEQSSDLILSVAAANTVVKVMKLGDGGNPNVGEFSDFMCQRLHVDLETLIRQMHDLPEKVRSVQGAAGGVS